MKTTAPIPHATFDSVRSIIPGASAFTAAFITTLNEYLDVFACPSDLEAEKPRYPCLKCGTLHAGFRWGVHHGAGSCSECGWPARAYHFVTDETGTDLRLVMVLQYHPDSVKRTRKAAR